MHGELSQLLQNVREKLIKVAEIVGASLNQLKLFLSKLIPQEGLENKPTDEHVQIQGLQNTSIIKLHKDCEQKRFEESVSVEEVGGASISAAIVGVPYQFLLPGGNGIIEDFLFGPIACQTVRFKQQMMFSW